MKIPIVYASNMILQSSVGRSSWKHKYEHIIILCKRLWSVCSQKKQAICVYHKCQFTTTLLLLKYATVTASINPGDIGQYLWLSLCHSTSEERQFSSGNLSHSSFLLTQSNNIHPTALKRCNLAIQNE